jgi:hypothetical protein
MDNATLRYRLRSVTVRRNNEVEVGLTHNSWNNEPQRHREHREMRV